MTEEMRLQRRVSKNRVVTIDYTLTGEDGAVLDSSRGQEPLAYLHGTGSIIDGLEAALEGKSATLRIAARAKARATSASLTR